MRIGRKTGCCRHKRQSQSHYCNSSFDHAGIPAEVPVGVNSNYSLRLDGWILDARSGFQELAYLSFSAFQRFSF
ncbi:MAG: hypothetical protein DME46_04080 [Verrucomicrobia bacterium]|nr:MAG: hypothetical protein DME46_04080 [Verrucomicrobiota bacterium]